MHWLIAKAFKTLLSNTNIIELWSNTAIANMSTSFFAIKFLCANYAYLAVSPVPVILFFVYYIDLLALFTREDNKFYVFIEAAICIPIPLV